MLRIKSCTYPREALATSMSSEGWYAHTRIAAVTSGSSGELAIRGPGEYIHNSGAFDRFNNTEVRNVQWKGSLWLRQADPEEYEIGQHGTSIHMLSYPPIALLFGKPFAVVDKQNLVYEYYASDRYCIECGTGWETAGIGDVFGLYVEIRRQNWAPSSVTLSYHGYTQLYPITRQLLEERRQSLKRLLDGLDREVKVNLYQDPSPIRGWLLAALNFCAETFRAEGLRNSYYGQMCKTRTIVSGHPPSDFVRKIRWDLEWEYLPYMSHVDSWTTAELSTQGRDTLESLNYFSSNLVAYIKDLKTLGGSLESMLHFADHPSVKSAASAWLSGRYGDRLSYHDTRDLLKAIQRRIRDGSRSIGRSRLSHNGTYRGWQFSHTRTATVVAESDAGYVSLNAVNDLMRWDAWPTLDNTWDMIPLSFVVDWFLPISDFLGQLDAFIQAPYFNVSSSYVSDLLSVEFPYASEYATGQVEYRLYYRYPHKVLDDIRPFDVTPSLPTFSPINLIDAIALTVS